MAARSTKDSWEKMDAIHAEKQMANDPGFTLQEYCQRYGMSLAAANRRLNKLVEEKRLIGGWRLENGRRLRVYRFE